MHLKSIFLLTDVVSTSVYGCLTLSHMASEVLFTIWQGGQLASPVRTTLAKVKTILGADYTLAMLCSIMYAPCCQMLIFSNKAKSVVTVVTGKHYMPSAVGSTSFSMKIETLHLIVGLTIYLSRVLCLSSCLSSCHIPVVFLS
jgi:hypothetical protein